VGGPESQVSQDLLDDLGLFDECENPHCSATARADQRVYLVDESAIHYHFAFQTVELEKLV
jgi:hypothetical protein